MEAIEQQTVLLSPLSQIRTIKMAKHLTQEKNKSDREEKRDKKNSRKKKDYKSSSKSNNGDKGASSNLEREASCELCGQTYPYPVTYHMKMMHPGCGWHAGGKGLLLNIFQL